MKVAVSLTAHESELSLLDQCFNYLVVGEVDAVVVHVNPYSQFNTQFFLRLLAATPLRRKIFVNGLPMWGPVDPEKRWAMPYLHRFHVANFLYLRALMDFDLFCLDASNTLLVKSDLRHFLTGGEAFHHDAIVPDWLWNQELSKDNARRFFGDALCSAQHEGSVYANDSFARMCDVIMAYEKDQMDFLGGGAEFAVYPREEVTIPSAYRQLFPFSHSSRAPYIYLPWDVDLLWTPEKIEAILQDRIPLPPDKFGIKRINRDINDPLRIAIGKHFGYRYEMQKIIGRIKCNAILDCPGGLNSVPPA